MSENFRILLENKADSAELSIEPNPFGTWGFFPITNLQKYSNSRVCKFYEDNVSIYGNYSVESVINCAALWRNDFTPDTEWNLTLYSDFDQGGDILYSSGNQIALERKALDELYWGEDPLNVTVFDSGATPYSVIWCEGFLAKSFKIDLISVKDKSVARLYMGRYFSTEINAAFGAACTFTDETVQTRTSGGSLWSDPVEQFRKIIFDLENLSSSERARVVEGFRKVGKRSDVFLSFFPDSGGQRESDYCFAGKFTNNFDVVHDFYNNFSTQFQIEEA